MFFRQIGHCLHVEEMMQIDPEVAMEIEEGSRGRIRRLGTHLRCRHAHAEEHPKQWAKAFYERSGHRALLVEEVVNRPVCYLDSMRRRPRCPHRVRGHVVAGVRAENLMWYHVNRAWHVTC